GAGSVDILITGDVHQNGLTQDRADDTVNSFVIQPFTNAASGTLSISGSDPLISNPPTTRILRLGAGGITDTSTATVAFQGNGGSITFTTIRKLILTADQTWSIAKGGTGSSAPIFSMRRQIEGNFKITKVGAGSLEFMGDNSS